MIEVYYAKFYQAVQLGKDGHTFLGGKEPKIRGAKMTYANGLLKIEAPGIKVTHVPFSNIMFMHEMPEEEGKKKK